MDIIFLLLPKFSTDCAADNEAKNKDKIGSLDTFINIEKIDISVSPAPILSITFLVYAAELKNFFLLCENNIAPSEPL